MMTVGTPIKHLQPLLPPVEKKQQTNPRKYKKAQINSEIVEEK